MRPGGHGAGPHACSRGSMAACVCHRRGAQGGHSLAVRSSWVHPADRGPHLDSHQGSLRSSPQSRDPSWTPVRGEVRSGVWAGEASRGSNQNGCGPLTCGNERGHVASAAPPLLRAAVCAFRDVGQASPLLRATTNVLTILLLPPEGRHVGYIPWARSTHRPSQRRVCACLQLGTKAGG